EAIDAHETKGASQRVAGWSKREARLGRFDQVISRLDATHRVMAARRSYAGPSRKRAAVAPLGRHGDPTDPLAARGFNVSANGIAVRVQPRKVKRQRGLIRKSGRVVRDGVVQRKTARAEHDEAFHTGAFEPAFRIGMARVANGLVKGRAVSRGNL